ncbi:MAG: arginine--tRNA ligase [Nanoarchaeota archaeon]
MKKLVVDVLEKALKNKGIKISREEIEEKIGVPPSQDMGDYSFPCFFLAEKLKDNPHEIALELLEKIKTPKATDFDDIQVAGPYINFFIDRKNLARKVVWETISQKKKYGAEKIGAGKKLIVEFSSPNIAKPFGIGHLRGTIIGNSIANIAEFLGYKVVRINYLGDWGSQFGKVLFGYEKFGNEKKFMKNPIEHLYEVYVKANKKIYEKKSSAWFKKLEDQDKSALMLWKAFRDSSIEAFEKIYKDLGIKFDEYSGESESVKRVNEMMDELEKKKLVKKSEGALIVDLTKYDLDVCMMVKSDLGTTYALRDLSEAIYRYKKYKFDMMIYEVGQEQTLHFKQFFKVLELMGYSWVKNCLHNDHGFYLNTKGKKFSTRKGQTVFMKDILEETKNLAKKEIQKRGEKLKKEELEERALRVAVAAIFYGDLKNYRRSNIVFDIKKFVSFEGDTGPYLLYSYARASSIIRKAKKHGEKFEITDLNEQELDLAKKIYQFEETVVKAFNSTAPSVIANYAYELAKSFNEFYHSSPVIGSKEEPFRIALVEAFRITLRNSLNLLGIKAIEEM